MPAPTGNTNAMTTGLDLVERGGVACLTREQRKALRYSLPAPRLPKRERPVEVRVDEFRRSLEDETAAVHGGISITQAATIGAAVDHERGRQFLAHRLRRLEDGGNEQDLATVTKVFEAMGRCTDRRNAAIAALDLDSTPDDGGYGDLLPTRARTAPTDPPAASDGPRGPNHEPAPKHESGDSVASHEVPPEPPESALDECA